MRKVLQTLCLLLVSCTLLLTGCEFGRYELYAGTWEARIFRSASLRSTLSP